MKIRPKHWEFKAVFGRSKYNSDAHQFFITPALGFIDRRHYFGYLHFTLSVAWLWWGAYIEIIHKD